MDGQKKCHKTGHLRRLSSSGRSFATSWTPRNISQAELVVENGIFYVENVVFDVENTVFDIENVVFDVENIVFDVENIVFDVENDVFDIENGVFHVENDVQCFVLLELCRNLSAVSAA